MSRENVELLRSFLPAPDFDLAAMFRDDDAFASWSAAVGSLIHADFVCVMEDPTVGGPTTYPGLGGLRAAWLDWTTPWATYRTEIEQMIDAGDRVVVFVRDFGRREKGSREVSMIGTAVWTMSDATIARVEFHTNRAAALKAAGLER